MSDRNETFSMTPPMSPMTYIEELLPAQPLNISSNSKDEVYTGDKLTQVCFICAGEVSPGKLAFHSDSCLKSGVLSRLLCDDMINTCTIWSTSIVELFGYQFVTQIALQENMQQLFMLAKVCVNSILGGTMGHMFNQQGKNIQFFEDRKNLKLFLEYVVMFIERCLPVDTKQKHELLDNVIANLHELLLYVGRISDLQVSLVLSMAESGFKSSYPLTHQYHVFLDVYWSLIEIIFTIQQQNPDYNTKLYIIPAEDNDNNMTLLDQLIHIILSDLVNLAVYRKDKICESRSNDVSVFTCTCCVELWVMIIHTVQYIHKKKNGESLMVRLHRILQNIEDQSVNTEEDMEIDSTLFYRAIEKPKNSLNFNLWLTVNVARLFSVDATGNIKKIEKNDNNYYMIESILKRTLAQENLSEIDLRYQLRLCLSVCQIWEPTTSLIVLLWDYFFRRLNCNFMLPASGVRALATVSLTPLSLLEKCRKSNNQDVVEQDTSFGLFLRILSYNLSRFVQGGSMQEWRQMKGRFYSKFHQRRLQELSEVGLENFTTLFLTLAVTVELEDVAGKLIDFYNMLDFTNLNPAKRAVVLRGSLALIHIYIENRMDTTFISEKLVDYFNILCREMEDVGDPHKHHGIWKLFCLYIDSVQDILESSPTLTCSEHKLLGKGLSSVWSILGESELRHCISVFISIITRLRVIISSSQEIETSVQRWRVNPQHEVLGLYLWQKVYPFIKDHACTQTPPPVLADLAASFTLLSKQIPPSVIVKDKFVSHVEYFGLSENVHVSISCRYLSQVLTESGAIECILSVCQQSTLIQAWFRCVLLTSPSSTELHNINRVILELSDVKELLSKTALTAPVDVMPKVFIKSLGQLYQNAANLKEKMLLREKVMVYFSLVPQHVAPVLKLMAPQDTLKTMFTTVGYLVKHCSPLLFVQSNPNCPLPAILSAMVTPHFLFNTDKPINSAFLAVIRDSLHMYIQGLSKLDFRRAAYVERRLKDIVSIYLQKFPIKSSFTMNESTAIHPLISCLNESYIKTPSLTSINFRHFILEILHEKYLRLKNMSVPPSANLGLSFVTEVLQRTSSGEVIARDNKVLLMTILEYVLFSTSPAMKQHAGKIMQFLIEGCVRNTSTFPIDELAGIIKRFINLYSKMYYDGVFNVLESISILYKHLIICIIPDCTTLVIDLEIKRGVGIDSKLRKVYYNLLSNLGEDGQKEIDRLQANVS
ncbi:hypothetical protein SNE40_018627 [Patella caerulea]|uniref:Protein MMS22-like n=1 Tax=Patella caerulea TaxID=87958 RepID=A0AAN8J7R0_PATCE